MDQLREVEPEAFLGEEDLWVELEELASLINSKLADADRRLQ